MRPEQAAPGEDAPRRSAPSQPARGKRRHADEAHASHELPPEATALDSPTLNLFPAADAEGAGRDSPPRVRKRRTAAAATPSAAHLSALAAQAAELGAAAEHTQAHDPDSAAAAPPAGAARRARTRWGGADASAQPARRVVARSGGPRRSAPVADAGARALAAVELGEQDARPPAAHGDQLEPDQAGLEVGGAGAYVDVAQAEADLRSSVDEALADVAARGLAEEAAVAQADAAGEGLAGAALGAC